MARSKPKEEYKTVERYVTTIKAAIGPNFINEIVAAGLGPLPISWNGEEVRYRCDQMTPDQVEQLHALIEAHDASLSDQTAYRELRAAQYPSIGDQLDALMKWLATENEVSIPAQLKSIAMQCMSVKAKYPKPAGAA